MTLFMLVLETQGNQGYIFVTGRERLARGASELLQASTTMWVLEAAGLAPGGAVTLAERRELLRTASDRWFGGASGDGLNVVIATSGRSVVLSRSRAALERVVSEVTSRAIAETPGLQLVGAIVDIDESGSETLGRAQRRASVRLGINAATLPSPLARGLQIPVVEVCAESQRPAEVVVRRGDDRVRVSRVVETQSEAATRSHARLQRVTESELLADNVDKILSGKSWRAVVHADGNGVGKVFIGLSALLCDASSSFDMNLRRWVDGYRDFSMALEEATERAFAAAVLAVGGEKVFPILLGGDDFTAEVSADCAREFIRVYLTEFEEESARAADVLRGHVPAEQRSKVPVRFSAAAGVAVVKAHFPFRTAYELAEDLLAEAKTAKWAAATASQSVSAFDFHVLYDSTSTGLDNIRSGRTSRDHRRLWGGPYVLGTTDGFRSVSDLDTLVASLRAIGRSRQVNSVAQSLYQGTEEATRALNNMKITGAASNLDEVSELVVDGASRSLLLDAMDVIDIEGSVAR